jgi:hypothetical protein
MGIVQEPGMGARVYGSGRGKIEAGGGKSASTVQRWVLMHQ